MARDVNGQYTLPPGNPVAPNTIIESVWANATCNDIAVALSDSLSRSGLGGMLAPFKNADGVISAPGITWANEPASGWYRKSPNNFWYAINGVDIFGLTPGGVVLSAGLTATGFAGAVHVQDAEPAPVKNGEQWFESDTGAQYVRYQNPDSTFTWILNNSVVVGNFATLVGGVVPLSQLPPQAQGITTLVAVAVTGLPSADFVVPSGVKRITVMLIGVSNQAGNISPRIQIGPNAGNFPALAYVSGAWQGGSGDTVISLTTAFTLAPDAIPAVTWSGSAVLDAFDSNIWMCRGAIVRSDGVVPNSAGYVALAPGPIGALRVTLGGQLFDAGFVNLSYEF